MAPRSGQVFVNLRPNASSDHLGLKTKIVELFKSYRLVYIKLISVTFRRGIELAHVGPCMKLTADADCPQSCDEEQQNDTVICGSDGNVYRLVA